MLGKIFKAVVDIATSPIAIAKDIATLGGTATGQKKSYTTQKLEQIEEDLDEIA